MFSKSKTIQTMLHISLQNRRHILIRPCLSIARICAIPWLYRGYSQGQLSSDTTIQKLAESLIETRAK